MSEITDQEWYELVKAGEDAGWKLVWERVVSTEAKSMRSAELLHKYSMTAGDLMGMLYNEMLGRRKIELYGGRGSFEGWLRRYVRGFILNGDPNRHGEISIDTPREDGSAAFDLPTEDKEVIRKEVWDVTHRCFLALWLSDPERAYVLIMKTRFHLSSEETRAFLDISSTANVDQIFSRAVKFMRAEWRRCDKGCE